MDFEIEMSRLVRDAEAKIAAKIAAQQMGECFDEPNNRVLFSVAGGRVRLVDEERVTW